MFETVGLYKFLRSVNREYYERSNVKKGSTVKVVT